MYGVKFLLAMAAICSALCCLILMWNEDSVTCGYTTCKLFETMFFCVALALTREVSTLNIEQNARV